MKALLLAGFDRSLVNFRGALIRDLVAAGCEVVAAAPPEHGDVPDRLAALGARFAGVGLSRAGLNPLADLATYGRLRRLFRRERPDLVLSYTIKPVIYGSLAAAREGVPRIAALITGLGSAFHSPGPRGRLLRAVAVRMYRAALHRCGAVFVQNPDIASLFSAHGILPRQRMIVVRGSGVDLREFPRQPVPEGPPCFLYLGRLLRDKGLREFAEAARRVRAELPQVRCVIAGAPDPNPSGIPLAEVQGWAADGVLEYLPHQVDVRPLLAACSVFVLPSYHEGMPRSVLEAMAVGRAIVTTDAIGCRETVRRPAGASPDADGIVQGDNGLLVPVGDAGALARAMLRLVRSPGLAEAMGARSRVTAEEEFDVRKVNQAMLAALGIIPAASRS